MNRRTFLKRAGSITAAVAFSGCESNASTTDTSESSSLDGLSPESEPAVELPAQGEVRGGVGSDRDLEFDFSYRVDAVEDLGLDPSGDEPIDEVLNTVTVDDVLVEFPRGTYTYDGPIEGGPTNFGIRGATGDRRDVVIRPKPPGGRFLNLRDAQNVLVEGVMFDEMFRQDAGVENVVVVSDGAVVRDVEYVGLQDWAKCLSVRATDPDGTGRVENVRLAHPTRLLEYPDSILRFYVGSDHRGTLYVTDSEISNAGSNGLYASRTTGDIRVENCLFRNNQNASLRIAGRGSYVEDSRFVLDTDGSQYYSADDFGTVVGILWESGEFGKTGGYIEGCEMVCRSNPGNPILEVDGSAGGMTVRDCRIHNEVPGTEPIRVFSPGESTMIDGNPDRPWQIFLDNVTVTGVATDIDGAIEIRGRDLSMIRDSCIDADQSGDGIVLRDLQRCRIGDTSINVSGEPVVLDDATVRTQDVTYGRRCRE
jgi:hypothetical protein